MGNCVGGSNNNGDAGAESEKEFESVESEQEDFYKCLLLGSGQSGKTTIWKQLKINYSETKEFEDIDKEGFRTNIYFGLVETIQLLYARLQYLQNEGECDEKLQLSEENQKAMEIINEISLESFDFFTEDCSEIFAACSQLWSDNVIKSVYDTRVTIEIADWAAYFLDEMERISKKDYEVTMDDILRVRTKTTGIAYCDIGLGLNKPLRVFDVGGQRNERKKWMELFQEVAVVFFVAAVSEFDQNIYEDGVTNSIEESLLLFEKIIPNDWFKDSTIILFLNKTDVLKEKIKTKKVSDYFPEFGGEDSDLEQVVEYFKELYSKKNKRDRDIHIHMCVATDVEHFDETFQATKKLLVAKYEDDQNVD